MLPFIMAAVSGASSLAGDLMERKAAKKAKEDAITAYKKLLIPSIETDKRADRAGDTFYTKAMGELNSGAFAARGALNPETLKTLAYSKMAGGRAETEMDVYNQDLNFNRGIQQQLAQVESQPIPAINPLNAIEAAGSGYLAGAQLESALELNSQYASLMQSQTDYMKGMGQSPTVTDYFGIGIDRVGKFNVPQVAISGKTSYIPNIKPIKPITEEFDNYIELNPKKKKNNWLNFKVGG
ncbi:hypothetical protein [Immundisolibacter sp.]